jgi:putative tricarboxylic transport membrane protein
MKFNNQTLETAIGAACMALGCVMAVGAVSFPSEAGYQGVGPNFLPWVVSIVLVICGGMLIWEARRGGYAHRAEPEGSAVGHWPPFAWVSAALLANAATITTIGFILSCTLAFVLAVRGFYQSQGRLDLSAKAWAKDAAIGFAISAPVFWLFTLVLGINLPGLTSTGWL